MKRKREEGEGGLTMGEKGEEGEGDAGSVSVIGGGSVRKLFFVISAG